MPHAQKLHPLVGGVFYILSTAPNLVENSILRINNIIEDADHVLTPISISQRHFGNSSNFNI
ncbi:MULTISPECIES: hypothetical protein [unclassified Nostoc]|uniref:hypothetical protein n=1 Tax=unclassified Nostoc TaxID=2593658 RepID=UPI002631B4C4|nr:hypothetical protein [Nostoc sp. S13]MDF5736497.1 hypothetical protein [Nostoc sp. S13]